MEETTKNQNMLPMVLGAVLIIAIAGGAYYFTQMRTQENTQTDSMMAKGSQNPDGDTIDTTGTLEIDPTQKEFEIEASDFSYTVPEMKVKKGDTVKVVFINNEGMHDWNLDEFDAKTSVLQAGSSEEVTFVADQAGEFEYYCSVGNHRAMGMVGKFIVEE